MASQDLVITDSVHMRKSIATNRKAKYRYELLETYEAGLELKGYEIKSIRQKGANIEEAYVRPIKGELFLIGAHISPYIHAQDQDIDPTRNRKLLMHKSEIKRLIGKVNEKGMTIVPIELYISNGWAKLKVALARGKNTVDKRRAIKEREMKRAAQRAMKRRG